jgi:hypothetical protein
VCVLQFREKTGKFRHRGKVGFFGKFGKFGNFGKFGKFKQPCGL